MLRPYLLLESGVVTPSAIHAGEVVDESDRPEIGRRKRILNDGVGAVREYAGIADVDAGLTAEFGSESDRVEDRAGHGLVGEIGLVEDVVAVGRVLVGAEVDGGIGRIDRAGERTVGRIDVLVEFLVVGGDTCRS